MSINVRIPTILRTYTQDQSQVTAEGATLTEVLDSLESTYPRSVTSGHNHTADAGSRRTSCCP